MMLRLLCSNNNNKNNNNKDHVTSSSLYNRMNASAEDLDDDLDNTKITVQATCKTRMNIPKTTTNNNVVSLNYNSQQQEQPLSITDNSSSKNMHCIGENTQGEFASSSMNKYKYQKRAGKKDTKGTSKGFQMLSTRTVR